MSRAGKPELHEVQLAPEVVRILEPGGKAYRMGGCLIIVGKQRVGWHLTISRENRLPSWQEVHDARYALIPDEAVMVMLLPPKGEYVNLHQFCFQLYEIPRAYLDEEQDRL